MKRITYGFIFLLTVNNLCFAQDKKQPTPPTPPTEPNKPTVPGTPENTTSYPVFPSLPQRPSFSNTNNQNNGPVREIEKYELIVSEAFPQGNTRQNAANTIKKAQYIYYSNNTIQIKLDFTNGLQYVYHLRNSRSKVEMQHGIFRETYETIIQAGKEFLLEQYLSELYRNEHNITSLTVIGNNKVVVVLNFNKKQ
ncbi:MAG: hypothetical protein LBV17_04070 [Treponema sp.]|jgi:hypothetical protein|nr:hypothetical protein [Treponema sp.]